jgi:DNA-binding winged helix-turn-helix (wHTH) protein
MRQFRLIEVFMQRPGTAFSFQELRLAVWGPSSTIEDATVVSEIGRLRQAIGYRYGKNPIKTVRGVGFMFETEPSKAKQRRPTSSDRRLRKAETLGSDGQYEGDDPTQKQHAGRAD